MPSIRVGAALTRIPPARYFREHGLIELHPSTSFPKQGTLARWREDVPEACEIAIAVPRRMQAGKSGAFAFEKEGARTYLDDAIRIFKPRFVVLFTGAELSTSTRDRAALKGFVEGVQAKGAQVIWQPRGLWDAEDALKLATEAGFHVALDLLAETVPAAEPRALAYGRVSAMGTHARLGDGHLRRALEDALSTGAEEVRLIIESEDAFKKAARLAGIVTGLADEDSGLGVPRRTGDEDEDEDDLEDDGAVTGEEDDDDDDEDEDEDDEE